MTHPQIGISLIIRILSLILVAGLAGCAPKAIFFHESTKVGFSATYNTSDSQPVSSHFGFKRRIAAVVPGQERVLGEDGKEKNATNKGDALSLVSKFYVRVGKTYQEGIEIRNNFATGNAARVLTRSKDAAETTSALMHNQVVTVSDSVDKTNISPAQAVEEVAARIRSKRTRSSSAPTSRGEISSKADTSPAPPETPAVDLAPNPTPSSAQREVGSDAVINQIPGITPTPDQ